MSIDWSVCPTCSPPIVPSGLVSSGQYSCSTGTITCSPAANYIAHVDPAVSLEAKTENCNECKGKGTIVLLINSVDCKKCNGTGKLASL